MIASNSSVHNSNLHIFDVERYVGWGCILNCFMLSSLPCFYAVCWSAIPTSCYIFNVFYSCLISKIQLELWTFQSTQELSWQPF